MEPTDYPETPDEEIREEREMIDTAESNAPPAMLRAQREWDRKMDR